MQIWIAPLALAVLLTASVPPAFAKPDIQSTPSPTVAAPAIDPASASAQTAHDIIDLSRELADIIAESNTPGMVAAIVTSDGGPRVVARGAAGIRARGTDAKVTFDDQFHLGSCTKAMTATLCAILVEEGKLDWDKPLAELLPEYANTMNPAYKSVTLRDQLHHRAGIPNDLTASGIWKSMWEFKGSPGDARAELLPKVLELPPVGTPRETYLYSNASYAIAGWLCERAVNQKYETLIEERLWKPLGITTGGFGAPGSGTEIDQPRGHKGNGKAMKPGPGADNPHAIAPAGTAHMSITDWSKFVAMHLAAERAAQLSKPAHGLLLSTKSFATLHAKVDSATGEGKDYAMGWGVTSRPWADGITLTHAGSNTMWFCVTWLAPKKDFAVLVACNAGDEASKKAADRAVGAAIKAYGKRSQNDAR